MRETDGQTHNVRNRETDTESWGGEGMRENEKEMERKRERERGEREREVYELETPARYFQSPTRRGRRANKET